MKGLGTNEKALIEVLCYRSNEQRQELKSKYKTMFGRDLKSDLKSELSGNFEKVMVGLLKEPADFDAYCIKKAVQGAGTNERALVEILCSRTNKEIEAIKASYQTMYQKDMEKAVGSDVSGNFKNILMSLMTASRDPEPEEDVNEEEAATEAQALYNAGEGKLGTDESIFNMILGSRSYSMLRAIFKAYEKISSKSIEQAIKSETSGDLERAYLAIVQCSKDRIEYFADQLYKSMKGMGTDDQTLIRVMVSRCEVDLEDIKTSFQQKHSKTLHSFIEGDASGDYRRCLLALCRN